MTNILIREVDPQIYARFKAKAAESGLKLGEALTRAMVGWIESQNTLSEKDDQRARNLAAYRRLKKTLEDNFQGKWVLISRGELLETGDTFEPIQNKMKELNLLGEQCFVFQVGKKYSQRNFGFGRRITR